MIDEKQHPFPLDEKRGGREGKGDLSSGRGPLRLERQCHMPGGCCHADNHILCIANDGREGCATKLLIDIRFDQFQYLGRRVNAPKRSLDEMHPQASVMRHWLRCRAEVAWAKEKDWRRLAGDHDGVTSQNMRMHIGD